MHPRPPKPRGAACPKKTAKSTRPYSESKKNHIKKGKINNKKEERGHFQRIVKVAKALDRAGVFFGHGRTSAGLGWEAREVNAK